MDCGRGKIRNSVCALTTHFLLGPVDAFDVRPAEGVLAETRTTSLELTRSFHDIYEVSG